MKVTKFEHSCLDIKSGVGRVVIDPGVYTKSLTDIAGIAAVVVTHIHPDHFDPNQLKQIVAENPQVQIFTTEEVSKEFSQNVTVPERNRPYVLPGITLEFFGEQHATIVPEYPVAQNMGVLVSEQLYYPGDSFTECPKSYSVLAVPTFAPWLKYAEVAEFTAKSSAQKVFPMHNGFLNDDGNALYDRLLGGTCQQLGKDYQFITSGEAIEI